METIIIDKKDSVWNISINRPQQLNALNRTVISELLQTAEEARHLFPKLRCLVISGSGDKAFVAGADIAEMSSLKPQEAQDFARLGQQLSLAFESLPQVVIAQVKGFALGGGCELAMACDLIYAATDAKFGQPEVNLGLIPGFGGTQRLARRVGLPVALDLILCGRGRMLTGAEAAEKGLVSQAVPAAELEAVVEKAVKNILACGPRAIAQAKRLTRGSYAMSLESGLAAEADAFAGCFAGEEAREGMDAFVKKRTPAF